MGYQAHRSSLGQFWGMVSSDVLQVVVVKDLAPFIDIETMTVQKFKYTCVKTYESPAWPSHLLPMFARISLSISQHCSSFPAPSRFGINQ